MEKNSSICDNEVSMVANQLDDSANASVLTKRRNIALIGVYIAGLVILPIVIMAIIISIRGYSMEYFQGDGFLGILSLTNFLAYVILCTAMVLLTHKVYKQDFQKIDSWGRFFKQVGIGLIFTSGLAFFGNTVVMLLGTTEDGLNESALVAMPIITIIAVVIFAPIVEEIIFRLVLMNLFNWKPIHKLIFSSLLFGLSYVIAGGFLNVIPYFLLGLVLGYFYLKYNNIWQVTIMHVLHNVGTAIILLSLQASL